MSPLAFLLIALVLTALGCAGLWVRHRAPSSYDSGIKAFRREMDALAPPEGEGDGDPPAGRARRR